MDVAESPIIAVSNRTTIRPSLPRLSLASDGFGFGSFCAYQDEHQLLASSRRSTQFELPYSPSFVPYIAHFAQFAHHTTLCQPASSSINHPHSTCACHQAAWDDTRPASKASWGYCEQALEQALEPALPALHTHSPDRIVTINPLLLIRKQTMDSSTGKRSREDTASTVSLLPAKKSKQTTSVGSATSTSSTSSFASCDSDQPPVLRLDVIPAFKSIHYDGPVRCKSPHPPPSPKSF